MFIIFNNYVFSIIKTNQNINIIVININNTIYEVNITQNNLSNNFNINTFYIFIIKCLEKNKYYHVKFINKYTQLFIKFSLIINDLYICHDIILKLKILNNKQKNNEINYLTKKIINLQIENESLLNCDNLIKTINEKKQYISKVNKLISNISLYKQNYLLLSS